ncbi:hypothetical protein ACU4GD_19675 [Cupriavidus basilensis]
MPKAARTGVEAIDFRGDEYLFYPSFPIHLRADPVHRRRHPRQPEHAPRERLSPRTAGAGAGRPQLRRYRDRAGGIAGGITTTTCRPSTCPASWSITWW